MRTSRMLSGEVLLEISSAEILGSIWALADAGIGIHHVNRTDELTAIICIDRKDLRNTAAILKKRGEKYTVQRQRGVDLFLRTMLRRRVLTFGILLLLITAYYLSSHILIIQVEGNERIPAQQILSQVNDVGLHLFTQRRDIRSEKVKNALLAANPELQWAGVNTYGCKAVVSVKEKAKSDAPNNSSQAYGSIVAAEDGIVRSMTVLDGTALCQEGQLVRKGETLISGYIDSGLKIRAVRARGEIYADTVHSVSAVIPSECISAVPILEQTDSIILCIGKKQIKIWKGSGIWDSSCGRIYEEYFIPLPGGFQLPVMLRIERSIVYQEVDEAISQEMAAQILSDTVRHSLLRQMIAGKILTCKENISDVPGTFCLSGQYHCLEMIGREHLE